MGKIGQARQCGAYIKKTIIRLELGQYWVWAALRVLITVLPQTGYVHPDEYFQSVEVFAGNVFKAEVSVPWEFNATFPVRSVTVMYLVTSLPLSLLRFLSRVVGPSLLTPYLILLFPRLTICLLSFISDFCLYKICYLYGQNFRRRLLIFASSYVTLIYCTRTLSNTVELILFNILLYLVASCMAESEKINYQEDFLVEKYEEAKSTSDKVRLIKLRKLLPPHSISRCFPIALVAVAGVFNRPTFLTYLVPPVFYWLQRGIRRSESLLHFHSRFLLLFVYAVPVSLGLIYLDSAYYGYITWGDIINLDLGFHSFVVTPLNFLRYNLDSNNLAEHGLHPRWLHVLINLPLLFNILALAAFLVMINMLYRGSQSYWTQLPKPQSITGMMTFAFIVPVVALSVIPHQEPRFIAPVLLPLVFLYSHLMTRFEEDCPAPARRPNKLRQLPFLEAFDNRPNITGRFLTYLNSEAVTGKPEDRGVGRYELLKVWFVINLLLAGFFGFVHQGGVYPLARSFHGRLAAQPKYTTYHLVYSHVYPLPQHLLIQPAHPSGRAASFHTSRLTSSPDTNLKRILTTLRVAEELKRTRRRNYRLFYALPAAAFNEFQTSHGKWASRLTTNFTYRVEEVFWPHLSLEAPFRVPDIFSWPDIRSCFELLLLEVTLVKEEVKS